MNPENRKQYIFLAVVVVCLIGVLGYNFLIAGGGTTTPANSGAASATQAQAAATAGGTRINQPRFEGDLNQLLAGIAQVTFDYRTAVGDRPSPMKPKIATRVMIDDNGEGGELRTYDVQRLRVSGIIWDETSPYAVVEGEVVWNGYDYGNGLTVQKIEQNRVIFELDGFRIPVEMEEL